MSDNEKGQTLANGSTLLSPGIHKNAYAKEALIEKLTSKPSMSQNIEHLAETQSVKTEPEEKLVANLNAEKQKMTNTSKNKDNKEIKLPISEESDSDEMDDEAREDLMMQAELLSGLSANKFSQVITNLCSSSNIKKYSKIVKNAKTQKETNEFEVMNGFQVQNFQEAISKSSDIKLQKINSFNKLAGNGKKSLLDVKHKYTFAIMQGNNHKLLNRIME